MKKLKKALLIAGMALCLGGGIGTAAAAISANQAEGHGEGNFDKAINLYWGGENSTVTLADMTDLTVNVPEYRILNVSSKSTKSVAGKVTLTFTLSAGTVEADKTASIKDLEIKVYTVDAGTTAEAAASIDYSAMTAAAAVNADTTSDTAEITIASGAAAHETTTTYAIQVTYTGATVLGANEVLAAELTISQSFSAAE